MTRGDADGALPGDVDTEALVAAVEQLAHLARFMADADLSGLACSEADAIAGVLRAIGADDAAENIVAAHASGDTSPDDLHHDVYLASGRVSVAFHADGRPCLRVVSREDCSEPHRYGPTFETSG